jgi:hypothetical protein
MVDGTTQWLVHWGEADEDEAVDWEWRRQNLSDWWCLRGDGKGYQ